MQTSVSVFSSDKSHVLFLGWERREGPLSQREIYACFEVEKGRREKFSYVCCFLNCLQFKRILKSKWHILGVAYSDSIQ